jgi:hypothetical protein
VNSRTDDPIISSDTSWDNAVAGVRPENKRLLVAQAKQKHVAGREKPQRRKVGPAKKTIKFLGCVTLDLNREFKIYAHRVWKTKKKNIKPISSWTQLKNLLRQFAKINKLALETHGAPGELTIGKIYRLDDPELIKLFSKNMPTITELYLGGCNVGRDPVPLVTFGKLFNVTTITAWSLFHNVQEQFVIIEKRLRNKSEFEEIQNLYKGYWVGGMPTDRKLRSLGKGKHGFLVEWFSQTPQWGAILPKKIRADDLDDKYHYISPADAETWEITPDQAQETREKLEPTKQWARLVKVIIKF